MNRILGKVIVAETRAGIADLLVVAYGVVDASLPYDLVGEVCGDDLSSKMAGVRVGSTVTDDDGRFELVYEPEALRTKKQTRPASLAIVVAAPADAHGGPRLIHVSRDVRRDVAQTESYLVRISSHDLGETDRPRAGEPMRAIADAVRLADRMKMMALDARKDGGVTVRFSDRYRAQRTRVETAFRGSAPEVRPARSFPSTLPVAIDAPNGDRHEVSVDPESGRMVLRTNGAAPVALKYAGVRFAEHGDGPEETTLFVDHKLRTVALRLPRSPNRLEAAEPDPSALYRWQASTRRKAEAAEAPGD